jgi:CheY-like chemotaxis protein
MHDHRDSTPPHPPLPATLRVLVVEDNPDAQFLVCEMLKVFGHTVTGTGNAEDALLSLAASRYDVLLSDVSLPGMSGVELARRALQAQPGLGVVFASGYGDSLAARVDFPCISLKKPYELEQLQAALATASAAPSSTAPSGTAPSGTASSGTAAAGTGPSCGGNGVR